MLEHLNGPLCPQSLPPMNQAHLLAVDIANRAFEAADRHRDATGEMVREAEDVNAAAQSYGGMRLYVESWNGPVRGQWVTVHGYYWRCQTCGFVLPGVGTHRP